MLLTQQLVSYDTEHQSKIAIKIQSSVAPFKKGIRAYFLSQFSRSVNQFRSMNLDDEVAYLTSMMEAHARFMTPKNTSYSLRGPFAHFAKYHNVKLRAIASSLPFHNTVRQPDP